MKNQNPQTIHSTSSLKRDKQKKHIIAVFFTKKKIINETRNFDSSVLCKNLDYRFSLAWPPTFANWPNRFLGNNISLDCVQITEGIHDARVSHPSEADEPTRVSGYASAPRG